MIIVSINDKKVKEDPLLFVGKVFKEYCYYTGSKLMNISDLTSRDVYYLGRDASKIVIDSVRVTFIPRNSSILKKYASIEENSFGSYLNTGLNLIKLHGISDADRNLFKMLLSTEKHDLYQVLKITGYFRVKDSIEDASKFIVMFIAGMTDTSWKYFNVDEYSYAFKFGYTNAGEIPDRYEIVVDTSSLISYMCSLKSSICKRQLTFKLYNSKTGAFKTVQNKHILYNPNNEYDMMNVISPMAINLDENVLECNIDPSYNRINKIEMLPYELLKICEDDNVEIDSSSRSVQLKLKNKIEKGEDYLEDPIKFLTYDTYNNIVVSDINAVMSYVKHYFVPVSKYRSFVKENNIKNKIKLANEIRSKYDKTVDGIGLINDEIDKIKNNNKPPLVINVNAVDGEPSVEVDRNKYIVYYV